MTLNLKVINDIRDFKTVKGNRTPHTLKGVAGCDYYCGTAESVQSYPSSLSRHSALTGTEVWAFVSNATIVVRLSLIGSPSAQSTIC